MYGAGGSRIQAVYARSHGRYVHGADGEVVVEGYRVCRYAYVDVRGKRIRTQWVSVQVKSHPSALTGAQRRILYRTLERKLADIILTRSPNSETPLR